MIKQLYIFNAAAMMSTFSILLCRYYVCAFVVERILPPPKKTHNKTLEDCTVSGLFCNLMKLEQKH